MVRASFGQAGPHNGYQGNDRRWGVRSGMVTVMWGLVDRENPRSFRIVDGGLVPISSSWFACKSSEARSAAMRFSL